MKPKVELILNKSDPHAVGGNLLSGEVKLQVREEQLELVALEIVIECYVSNSNHGEVYSSGITVRVAGKMSSPVDKNSFFIVSSPVLLNKGMHSFPFAVPLPLEWPPSFKIYEYSVADYVACVATISHSGKNSVETLTDNCEFLYYPVSYIPDLEGETLTGTRVMQSMFHIKPPKVSKILPWTRKGNDEVQSRFRMSLTYPKSGFRQDKPNPFEIVIEPTDPKSPEITVQKLSLYFAFSAVEKWNVLRGEYLLNYKTILSKTMIPPSKVVKLTESLTYDKDDEPPIPSFITRKMSGKNRLKIDCTVTREVDGKIQIAELHRSYMYTVLSPHVAQDPQAAPKRDVKYEMDTPSQPTVANAQSNHTNSAQEEELPRYSSTPGNTQNFPEFNPEKQ